MSATEVFLAYLAHRQRAMADGYPPVTYATFCHYAAPHLSWRFA